MRHRLFPVPLLAACLLVACSNGHSDGASIRLRETLPEPVIRVSAPTEEALDDGGVIITGIAQPGCREATTPGAQARTLAWSGGERPYLLYVPTPYSEFVPTPLVLNFHGYGNSAEEIDTYSQLGVLAEREGFLLATPDGSGYPLGWDVSGVYGENGVDDVQMVVELLDQLQAEFCIDAGRVYAAGLSNGAEMASQLACLLPERFAAVAAVAGLVYQGCYGGPVPILAFHGTDDYNVPFELAPSSLAEWASHNGCEDAADSERITDHVVHEWFGGCAGNDAELYIVEGGGHTWPGAEPGAGGAGPVTDEIGANEIMWAFFKAHAKGP
jgi:polyhydroxybutyrate depolymerase